MRKAAKTIHLLYCFLVGSALGRIMYAKEYFPKGKCFSHWNSEGWAWVLADFHGRLFYHRNAGVPWPVSPLAKIGKNIEFDTDDLAVFQGAGCYFQTWYGKIHLGKGTQIAQNVGLITSNHDLDDPSKTGKVADIYIGDHCWIGMNSVILPGVQLGDHTVVGAGSVVTKSFPEGFCVGAGNPAKMIRKLSQTVSPHSEHSQFVELGQVIG